MVVGCQPYAPAAFTPRKYSWYSSRLSRPQGYSAIGRIMPMKNPLTPTGIEPATYRFVTQHTLSYVPYFNSRLQCSALCLCYFMRTRNYVGRRGGGGVLCVSSRQIAFSCSLRCKGSVMVPFGKCALL